MSMKARFRLYQRGGGIFYSFDNDTKAQKSLGTKNEHEAKRLLAQLNEAQIQPAINRQIARGYLMASDEKFNERTWRYVLDMVTEQKHGPTKERWLKVGSDKALKKLWGKKLIETTPDELLKMMASGCVSTNVFLRRLHNFALDMQWIVCPIVLKRKWPAVVYRPHRAITAGEHNKIIEKETNPERRGFYQLCWELGGSQGDVASLTVDDIDWQNHCVCYDRNKTEAPAKLHFGAKTAVILKVLPQSGPLFPYLKSVRSSDRATEFKQRCDGLGIKGVTLHSYRYAWAERAKKAGYPERYAMVNLGHNSKAVARAYGKQADMSLPSLEDWEKQTAAKVIPMPKPNEASVSLAKAG
jgi:integrase